MMHSKGLEYLVVLGLCFALGITIYSIKEKVKPCIELTACMGKEN